MGTAFTPGPWDAGWWGCLLRDLHNFAPSFIEEERREGFGYPGYGYGDEYADGRLIAAAPELYEALEWCVNHNGECLGDHATKLAEANEALAKARGGQ